MFSAQFEQFFYLFARLTPDLASKRSMLSLLNKTSASLPITRGSTVGSREPISVLGL